MSELVTHHEGIDAAYVSAKAQMTNCAGEITVKKMRRDQVIQDGDKFLIIPGRLQVICVMPNIPDPGDATKRSATVAWDIPTQRNNGNALLPTEIANYQLRYKATDAAEWIVVTTQGKPLMQVVNELEVSKTYEFQVLTIDADGLGGSYSPAVTLAAQ